MALSQISSIPRIHAGHGRIVVSSHNSTAVLSELSSKYPLKLLSPWTPQKNVAIVYALTYGGGLVGGDQVYLTVDVSLGAILVLLTQGSTKVFKSRPANRLASVQKNALTLTVSADPSSDTPSLVTTQRLEFLVAAQSALFLLPDPVTCFRSASYNQIQTFRLSGDASIVVLDWITSGRKSIGEEWAFSRYFSVNEVWINNKRIAKDVMLLNDEHPDAKLPERTLGERLAPYSCYAMVILYGPLVQKAIASMTEHYGTISVFKTQSPANLLWSLSPITSGEVPGTVVRVAGTETEVVRKWLGHALADIEQVVGLDVYRRAFA